MSDDDGGPEAGAEIRPRPADDPLLYRDLDAPDPIEADPSPAARWLAFAAVIGAGLLGGLIGYGTGDLMADSSLWAGIGAVVGAALAAGGVGIVAALTLRAMNEWQAVEHPESTTRARSGLIVKPSTDDEPE